jgi:predicted nucleic acid-binding protein
VKENVDCFIDTSVLIAAHDASRPGHESSLRLVSEANPVAFACAAHSLAEFYSVLSRLPGGWKQRPELAGALVEELAPRFTMVALTAQEYLSAIETAAHLRIAGVTIYDALPLKCARKVNAERIYTWNLRHFQLIAPDLAERIVTP